MAQVPGTGFAVRLAAAAPGSLPTAHPTRYPRRHGQTTRSAPGQPMTLGNMRANGVQSLLLSDTGHRLLPGSRQGGLGAPIRRAACGSPAGLPACIPALYG
jgi:hypothetical protein